MSLLSIIGIAISLAMDAFSVSITSGAVLKKPDFRQYFRIAFHFGLFQFFMPILGFYGGVLFESYINQYNHWVAFILLSLVGGKMFWESFQAEEDKTYSDPSRGKTLILLAIATSIDAAAIGFTFAALNEPIIFPSIIIGLICLIFSSMGIFIGSKVANRLGQWAERAGAVILLIIGVRILISALI